LSIVGNDLGMVMDFNDIKKEAAKVMQAFDHAVILEERDPLVPVLKGEGQNVFTMVERPTVENMAQVVLTLTGCDAVRMWETPNSHVEVERV